MTTTESTETSLCGIVLHPAGHTRSPRMHSAAYLALEIDARYEAFDVPPSELEAAIARFRDRGMRQIAVSLPHKSEVMQYLDEVDEQARKIGAVNTVTSVDGRLLGSNTDWIGATRAIERATRLPGKRCVVLGAGGSARAIVFGMLESGATSVHVLNRTLERAETLVNELGATGAGPLDALADLSYDILVNTTSVGLQSQESPVPASQLRSGTVVMDIVYDPVETRLLLDARRAGATVIEGKWMLVYQAAEQLQIWTGMEAPIDVLERAFVGD